MMCKACGRNMIQNIAGDGVDQPIIISQKPHESHNYLHDQLLRNMLQITLIIPYIHPYSWNYLSADPFPKKKKGQNRPWSLANTLFGSQVSTSHRIMAEHADGPVPTGRGSHCSCRALAQGTMAGRGWACSSLFIPMMAGKQLIVRLKNNMKLKQSNKNHGLGRPMILT